MANQTLISVLNNSDNTSFMHSGSNTLYYGLNGYGITWSYFLIHIAMILTAGAGILLNTAALRIVRSESCVNDGSKIFISHLATSDIFNGIICIYNAFYNLVHFKNYYECAFRTGLSTCINLNSSLHLLSLTFDRYFKIIHPYKYVRLFTETRMKLFSSCTWVVSITLGLLPILGWRLPSFNGLLYCSYFGVLDKQYLSLMCVLFFFIYFMLFYCYICIICAAWNQRRRIMVSLNDASAYTSWNTKALWWAPTKTVLILITFYSCCWLPIATVILLHLLGGFPSKFTNSEKGVVLAYVSSLVFLNIVANPVIYAFKIQRVRRRVLVQINKFSSQERLNSNRIRAIDEVNSLNQTITETSMTGHA